MSKLTNVFHTFASESVLYHQMKVKLIPLLLCICFGSCDYISSHKDPKIVARIGDNLLTKSQLSSLGKGLDSKDSLVIVSAYIRNWAKERLLFNQAEINLTEKKIERLNKLVADYKKELYSQAYIDVISINFKDTIITDSDYQKLYDSQKFDFRLKEDLVKVRYMYVSKRTSNLLKKKLLKKFEDADDLYNFSSLERSSHFPYAFNDSTWVRLNDLQKEFNNLQDRDVNSSLEKKEVVQVNHNKGLIFFRFLELKEQGNIAPLEFIKPALKRIIIIKRKQKFITQLENDLINQAIQKNKLKIYE